MAENAAAILWLLLGLGLLTFFPATAAYPIEIPNNISDIQHFKLPRSVTNPNIGVSIDDSVSLSVDPTTGEVNLAGGVSHGFGVDAGIFTKSLGDSVTFTRGKGQATGHGSGSAIGNGGASANGFIFAQVPSLSNGMAFSKSQALTKSIGQLARGSGTAVGVVG